MGAPAKRRHHHPQSRLPGHISRRRSFPSCGLPPGGLRDRRRRVLWRRRLPQGRPRSRRRHHHGQPDLCRGDLHAGGRHGPRRPAPRPRATRSPASSTASTPTSGIRRAMPSLPATYDARDARPPRRQQARASSSASGWIATTARSFRRGQPAHLAEGHGRPRRMRSTDWSRAAPGWRCSAPATRRSNGLFRAAAARHPGRIGVDHRL